MEIHNIKIIRKFVAYVKNGLRGCCQQIDLSAFVANELSAFPEQMASGGPTLPFPFWAPSVFLVHNSQPTFSAHEKQPASCPCTDGSAP